MKIYFPRRSKVAGNFSQRKSHTGSSVDQPDLLVVDHHPLVVVGAAVVLAKGPGPCRTIR